MKIGAMYIQWALVVLMVSLMCAAGYSAHESMNAELIQAHHDHDSLCVIVGELHVQDSLDFRRVLGSMGNVPDSLNYTMIVAWNERHLRYKQLESIANQQGCRK